ncbi:hypothetical protein GS438_22220 [Rhodococcus hoagii]|nr:hypothetical protein [Prescottella equi]
MTPETRREFEINVALIAETPAHPGLARIRDHAHRQLLDCSPASQRCSAVKQRRRPRQAARAAGVLALVDGLGLHLLHQSAGDDIGWALDIVRDELHRIKNAGTGD